MSRRNKAADRKEPVIVSGPVGTDTIVKEDPKDAERIKIAHQTALPEKPHVKFYGAGTIGPIINGKRYTIRFLPENGYMYSTTNEEVIDWLRKAGYSEKVKK